MVQAVRIPGTSTTPTPGPDPSTPRTSARSIWARVTSPSRRAVSRLPGNRPATQYNGNSKTGQRWDATLPNLPTGRWAEASVDFKIVAGQESFADELQFLAPPGAEFLLDDVLLYEP